jgi:hypothetical protein
MSVIERNEALKRIREIEGWLAPTAALFTLHMAKAQEHIDGSHGPMLEIGVHRGKFLALMRYMTSEKIVGVQLLESAHANAFAQSIKSTLNKVVGIAEPIDFIIADSLTLGPGDLLDALGSHPRLVHIDGSHLAGWVFHDMTICARILRAGSLLILDDAYNHTVPDVTEGIFRFLQQPEHKDVRPFAQCYNKLFLTTASHYHEYLLAAKAFLLNDAPEEVMRRTIARIEENKAVGYVPKLFGSEVAIFV